METYNKDMIYIAWEGLDAKYIYTYFGWEAMELSKLIQKQISILHVLITAR